MTSAMDLRNNPQKVSRCDLCDTPVPSMCCEICKLKLCKACVGEHLSDFSRKHKVIQFKQSESSITYPQCPYHARKHCEHYCKECDIPCCSFCISFGVHKDHNLSDISLKLSSTTEDLEKDLEALKKRIYPKYEEIVSALKTDQGTLEEHYGKLKTAVTTQGNELQREISNVVQKVKIKIDYMKNQHLAAIRKYEDEIQHEISEIKKAILDLQRILDSHDVSLASTYKSRMANFEKSVPGIRIELPCFNALSINPEQLYQQLGSLSDLSITATEQGYTMKTPEVATCPPSHAMLDEPKLFSIIDTGYHNLNSVTCLGDDEIMTCGNASIMKLYDLEGTLLKSIETKSGRVPCDITVKRNRNVVYTDPGEGTINILKNGQIQDVIRVQGWTPYHVCSTFSGDLLVAMVSNGDCQFKVSRYSGYTEKQSIQFDDNGKPLYSSSGSGNFYYISENKNLDICVSDCEGHALVVVSQSGKLRFRYTGQSSSYRSFRPYGITTDSHSHILLAEYDNHCIHILDKDGKFLRYIANCDLNFPIGLCVDTKDNLFVAEIDGKVKKIKYI